MNDLIPQKPKKTILTDHEGNISSMRIMAMFALLVASALVVLPMFGVGECDPVDPTIILWFLGAAFGGKAFQKAAETKNRS